MPRRDFKTPFAVSGDQTAIPTDIQPDGSVSIVQGYGPDYQRPTDGSDPQAKTIERDKFNSLMNDVTASIGEVQLYGFAIWSAGMAPYPIGAYVRHADKVWRNTLANNTAEPGSSSSGWIDPASGGVQRFTADGTFVVPPGVTTVYVSGAGGGGGGGGGAGRTSSPNSSGGGGGGGAGRSAYKQPVSVTPGASISIKIGAGGARGAAGSTGGSGGNGTAGGDTLFGTLLSLPGGAGGGLGRAGDGAGGAGGSPGGAWGGDGIAGGRGGDGGSGGSCPFGTAGGGGRARASAGAAEPTTAAGFGVGGGGGGAAYSSATSGTQGGNGMPGILIVEW